MHDVQLKLDKDGRGSFYIESETRKVAEMVVVSNEENITVFHTEVIDELKGKGVASQLLYSLVEFAREQGKKIIPLCVYVRAQFDRYPEKYADVWNRDWHDANKK